MSHPAPDGGIVRDLALVLRGRLMPRGTERLRRALRKEALQLPCGRLLRWYPAGAAELDHRGDAAKPEASPSRTLEELRRPRAALLLAVERSSLCPQGGVDDSAGCCADDASRATPVADRGLLCRLVFVAIA